MANGKRYKFAGSTFQVVSSYATSKTITAITKANPAVVTIVGHGYAVGDVVKLAGIGGMTELSDQLFAISAVTTDTFTLAGVDSTTYGTFTTGGTASKGVFSSSCEITSYTGDSGSTSEVVTETNCSRQVDFGQTDAGSVSIAYSKAPGDFQLALNDSRKNVTETALKTTLVNSGGTMIDIGVVVQVGNSASAGGIWQGSATLRRTSDRVDLA